MKYLRILLISILICGLTNICYADDLVADINKHQNSKQKDPSFDHRSILTKLGTLRLDPSISMDMFNHGQINEGKYGYDFEGFAKVQHKLVRSYFRKLLKESLKRGPQDFGTESYFDHLEMSARIRAVLDGYYIDPPEQTLEEALRAPENRNPTKIGQRTTILNLGPIYLYNDLRLKIDSLSIDLFENLRSEDEIDDWDEYDQDEIEKDKEKKERLIFASASFESKNIISFDRGNLYNSRILSLDGKISVRGRIKAEEPLNSITSSFALKFKGWLYNPSNKKKILQFRIKIRMPEYDEVTMAFSIIALEL